MRMIRYVSVGLVFILGIAGTAQAGLKIGSRAPRLAATAVQGNLPYIGGGRVTVLDFWATWCGPCIKSIPHVTAIQDRFSDKGLTVVGISREPDEVVRPFVKKMRNSMRYVVAIDKEGATSKAYMGGFEVETIPHAFIIDQRGIIVWHGHPQASGFLAKLLELMPEKKPEPIARAPEPIAPPPGPVGAPPGKRSHDQGIRSTGASLTERREPGAEQVLKKPTSTKGINFSWSDE